MLAGCCCTVVATQSSAKNNQNGNVETHCDAQGDFEGALKWQFEEVASRIMNCARVVNVLSTRRVHMTSTMLCNLFCASFNVRIA